MISMCSKIKLIAGILGTGYTQFLPITLALDIFMIL